MEFTRTDLDNATGHFQAAKRLMPYRGVIEKIVDEKEYLKSIVEVPYEKAISYIPELREMPREHCEFLQELVQLFTGDPVAPAAYLAMMDILEKHDTVTSPYPHGMPIFIPKQKNGAI